MREAVKAVCAALLCMAGSPGRTLEAQELPAPAADSAAAAAPAPFALVADSIVVAPGRGRGEVLEPAGIAADAFGRIYVTDAALHRMQRFGPGGAWLGEAGALGSRPGELRRPGSVALIGALGVAVLDRENRRIAAYDLFGRFSGILVDLEDPALTGEIGRVDPVALATDGGAAIYLADAERDRILTFDFGGRFLRTIGGFGAKPGSFRGLAGLGVSGDGMIVTAERGARRVQTLDAGGRPVAAWAVPLAAAGEAVAIAIGAHGEIAVADPGAERIWLFGSDGAPLAPPILATRPRALAFTSADRLLVAEGDRIARYRLVRTPSAPGD
jgi:hypothetical protein